MQKNTTNYFKNKSNKKHNNFYDYSLVDYINSKTKVKIICPIHGVFEQTPSNHYKYGCLKCSGKDKYNNITIKEKFNMVHNNFYDYSLVEYININTKVKIICPVHGEFEQTPRVHLKGGGCQKCKKNYRYTTNEIVEQFNIIHKNFYDYSLIKYKNIKTKVKIICPIHGDFEQTPKTHLNGFGCSKCSNNYKKTKDEIISEMNKVHKNKYQYCNFVFKTVKQKIDITCHIHGIFNQRIEHHLNGSCCPKCKKSKGENIIFNILTQNNILFEQQKTFDGCKLKQKLYFDFFIPSKNLCIEYNGLQHYKNIDYFGGIEDYEKRIKRDIIKKEFCEKNKINLLIIKYNDNIEEKIIKYNGI